MIENKQIERIGKLADKASNFWHAAQLPLRAETHAECLKTAMADIEKELKSIYREVTGEDPWGEG